MALIRLAAENIMYRCQALKALKRFEEAYEDAKNIISLEPDNKVIKPILASLYDIIQKRKKYACNRSKLLQILDLASNAGAEKLERETAMSKILTLASEETDDITIFREQDILKIIQIVKNEENEVIICTAMRIMGELCKYSIARNEFIIKTFGLLWSLEVINTTEKANAFQYCLQTMLNTYCGMDDEITSKPNETECKTYEKEIDTILLCLLHSITSRTITGFARDAIIEFLMRNLHYTELNWVERLIKLDGVQKLMEVASETVEYKYKSSLDITSSTQTTTSLCLAKIYENIGSDAVKENFNNVIDKFIENELLSSDTESQIRVVVAITTLLSSPLDAGNAIIAKEEIFEMIFVMAEMDDLLQQKVACECIVTAVTRKDKANIYTTTMMNKSINMLKKLYQSNDDSIRVLALVGLCKLANSGDIDGTITLFTDGATENLATVCKRFLIYHKKEKDMRKWALEGLSYLTFDTKVKEKFVEDQQAIESMFELVKTRDPSFAYSVVKILANLCNTYDKQELISEMINLIKFAKLYFPEEHELNNEDDDNIDNDNDDSNVINKRLCAIVKTGVTSAFMPNIRQDILPIIERLKNILQKRKFNITQSGKVTGDRSMISGTSRKRIDVSKMNIT